MFGATCINNVSAYIGRIHFNGIINIHVVNAYKPPFIDRIHFNGIAHVPRTVDYIQFNGDAYNTYTYR
jgi:hypothetical protein